MFSPEEIQTLNELECILYRYIAKNKEKVIYMRIRDLAKEAHVSTTTILRFCKKMNCVGFSEFKIKLKLEMEQDENELLRNDNTVFSEFMNRASSKDFQKLLEKACEEIYKCKTLLFIGIGSSGAMATFAARYFSSLDKFSVCIDDPYYPISKNYLEDSVIIVLSVSGETNTIIESVTKLKKNSLILSITNSKNCTLARISDINIPYYVQHQVYKGNDITTPLPVMYIIENLAKGTFSLIKKDKNI